MADGKSGNGLVKGVTVCGVVIPMILIAPIVLLMSFSTILVAMVQAQYGTTCGSTTSSSNTTTSWVEWAKNIAADDSHGYSQPRRNGNPDYDCSSLVYYALKQAGLDVALPRSARPTRARSWRKPVSNGMTGPRSRNCSPATSCGGRAIRRSTWATASSWARITTRTVASPVRSRRPDRRRDQRRLVRGGLHGLLPVQGAMNVETAGGKVTSAQAVSGKTKDDVWDGMSSTPRKRMV